MQSAGAVYWEVVIVKKGKNEYIQIRNTLSKKPASYKGYCGYIYELSNHLNTSFNSSAPVRVFSGGRILRLQKIFSKTLSSFWQSKKSPVLSREKEVLPPFGRKEVNTMTPNRREFEKQCAFQKFCKSVLHNEACNAHEEIRRRRVREVTFSNLALHEERQLYTVDKYFQDEEAEPSYQMAGKEITPKLLLEAIRALPEERRKIILLYYFEGLTDIEIGKQLNISRSTVQYRRTSSFEQLKKYLEENADEWIEW